eukprot:15445143-Alexandrium_andersonii.AAC.1
MCIRDRLPALDAPLAVMPARAVEGIARADDAMGVPRGREPAARGAKDGGLEPIPAANLVPTLAARHAHPARERGEVA